MKFYKSIGLLILLFGCVSVVNAQVPIVIQQGLGGYDGTHETTFQTGDPTAIWGDRVEWEWDGSDAGGMNFGMLRFDNITDLVPPDSVVISAMLTLVVTNEGSSSQIATMHELLVPFDDTMDFFEFGDHSGGDPLPGQDYVEEPIASIPGPSAGDVLEIDVTDSIKRILAGGDNFGWVFVPGGTNGVGIASSEANSNQPKLTIIIEGAAPPEAARVLPMQFVSAGSSFDVSIEVTPGGAGGDVTIVETLPAGFTASNISNGGTFAAGAITWNLSAVSSPVTLTYTVTAGAEPGSKAIWSGTVNKDFFVEGDTKVSLLESVGIFENHLDIGIPAADGDAMLENDTYTVLGSGNDIWGTSDNFHFLYLKVNGNFKMSIEEPYIGPYAPNPSSNNWQKMGIMAREELVGPSAYVYANLRSSDQAFMIQWRESNGASAAWDSAQLVGPAEWNPNWDAASDGITNPLLDQVTLGGKIILEREGNAFVASYEFDNQEWFVGEFEVALPDTLFVGVAVTSHQDGALSQGIFKNPVIEGTVVSVKAWMLY